MKKRLEVTEMFKEMIAGGYITPSEQFKNVEDLRMPGELPYMPTIATYGTVHVPATVGTRLYAELESRS